jgi:hypothetical protein
VRRVVWLVSWSWSSSWSWFRHLPMSSVGGAVCASTVCLVLLWVRRGAVPEAAYRLWRTFFFLFRWKKWMETRIARRRCEVTAARK